MKDYSARIHRIELPVPFPIKTTNVYLVDEDPMTLIDSGTKTEISFVALKDSLQTLGYQIDDIKRILITHGHVDHYGQARGIASQSGAEIYIHKRDYERIQAMEQFRGNLVSVLKQNGTPTGLIEGTLDYMKSVIGSLAEPLGEVSHINDGDEIHFQEMVFRSIHCPGHSPGLMCFYLEEGSILISGDHLLNEISPNPVIDLSRTGPGPQSTSLQDYLASVRKVEGLTVSLVLPGHGEPIQDFRGTLNKILLHHERRLSTVLSILSSRGKTAYEISQALFPNANTSEVFLGMSEVLGHLRILLDDGKIRFKSRRGIDYYSMKRA
ncbi:MAG: MBL fold metallo-hydrolase [Proteobacteria bacterium]|nr:MBL fold metallo-hydrolase [Pseudomonadota bacterium]